MGQAIFAGLIVLIAAVYAAWALMPAGLRLRLARRLSAAARRTGRLPWLASRAGEVIERNARQTLCGCSDCSAAQATPEPAEKPDKV